MDGLAFGHLRRGGGVRLYVCSCRKREQPPRAVQGRARHAFGLGSAAHHASRHAGGGDHAPFGRDRERPHHPPSGALCGQRYRAVRTVCGGQRRRFPTCRPPSAAGSPRRSSLPSPRIMRGGDEEAGQQSVLFAVKSTLFFALPAAAFLLFFAPQICALHLSFGDRGRRAKLSRGWCASSRLLPSSGDRADAFRLPHGAGQSEDLRARDGFCRVRQTHPRSHLAAKCAISVFGAAYACNACYLVALLVDLYYSITQRKARARASAYALLFAFASAAALLAAWPLSGVHILLAALAAGLCLSRRRGRCRFFRRARTQISLEEEDMITVVGVGL